MGATISIAGTMVGVLLTFFGWRVGRRQSQAVITALAHEGELLRQWLAK